MKTITSFHSITESFSTQSVAGIGQPFFRLGKVPGVFIATIVLLAGWFLSANASDPVGIYAVVDKVVLEPNEATPERAQVWGAFALARGRGETYEPAQRGYMYFKVGSEPEVARKEWVDLKSVAGTGQIVAFGSRHDPQGTLRKADAKPESPDPHPKGWGLIRVKVRDYKPLNELSALGRQPGGKPPGKR